MSEAQNTTVLLAAFEGWNDACQSATDVIRHLVATYESTEVRHIRCDGYYDYQVVRPITCNIQGRRRILWPQTTFYDITISPELHMLAQIAPEPNYRWLEYCRESLHVAEEFEVDRIITLGAMFADCPHTRPLPVDVSDSTCQCSMDQEYNGPVGIPTILDAMACEDGYDTTSMWVSIPQYLGCDECAPATLRLLDHLSMALGVALDGGTLVGKAERWRGKASALMRCNDDLNAYVKELERAYDGESPARDMPPFNAPQAEQLVKEAEEFLKDCGGASTA